jgi:hypothetical protein
MDDKDESDLVMVLNESETDSNPRKHEQMNKFTYNTVILLMSQNIIVKL